MTTPAERVEAGIRADLDKMKSGEALPSIRDLAATHQVSTATVSKALRRLRASGEVVSRPGWGTFKT